jgi:protein-arginine kinase activator protein McsA
MAHKRKDTLAAPMEWAKHLKPRGKQVQARLERRAAVQLIRLMKEEFIEQQDFEFAANLRDAERTLDGLG